MSESNHIETTNIPSSLHSNQKTHKKTNSSTSVSSGNDTPRPRFKTKSKSTRSFTITSSSKRSISASALLVTSTGNGVPSLSSTYTIPPQSPTLTMESVFSSQPIPTITEDYKIKKIPLPVTYTSSNTTSTTTTTTTTTTTSIVNGNNHKTKSASESKYLTLHQLLALNIPIYVSSSKLDPRWNPFLRITHSGKTVLVASSYFYDSLEEMDSMSEYPLYIAVRVCNQNTMRELLPLIILDKEILSNGSSSLCENILHGLFRGWKHSDYVKNTRIKSKSSDKEGNDSHPTPTVLYSKDVYTYYERFNVYALIVKYLNNANTLTKLLESKNAFGESAFSVIYHVMEVTGMNGLIEEVVSLKQKLYYQNLVTITNKLPTLNDLTSLKKENDYERGETLRSTLKSVPSRHSTTGYKSSIVSIFNLSNPLHNSRTMDTIISMDITNPSTITSFLAMLMLFYIEYCKISLGDKSRQQQQQYQQGNTTDDSSDDTSLDTIVSFTIRFGELGIYLDRIYHTVNTLRLSGFDHLLHQSNHYQIDLFDIGYNESNSKYFLIPATTTTAVTKTRINDSNPYQYHLTEKGKMDESSQKMMDELCNRVEISIPIHVDSHPLRISPVWKPYVYINSNMKKRATNRLIHCIHYKNESNETLLSLAIKACFYDFILILLRIETTHLDESTHPSTGDNILHSLFKGPSYLKSFTFRHRLKIFKILTKRFGSTSPTITRLLDQTDKSWFTASSPRQILDQLFNAIGVNELWEMIESTRFTNCYSHLEFTPREWIRICNPLIVTSQKEVTHDDDDSDTSSSSSDEFSRGNCYDEKTNLIVNTVNWLYLTLYMTESFHNRIRDEKLGMKEHRSILLTKDIGEYLLEKDPIVTLFFIEKYDPSRHRIIQFLNSVLNSNLSKLAELVDRVTRFASRYEYNNIQDFLDVLNE